MRTVNLNVVNLVCLNGLNDQLVNMVRGTVSAIRSYCLRISGFIAGKRKAMPAMRWQAAPYQPGAAGMGRTANLAGHTTVRGERGLGSSERLSTSLIASAS